MLFLYIFILPLIRNQVMQVILYDSTNQTNYTMYNNNARNTDFVPIEENYNCALPYIFTYTQDSNTYILNTPYTLQVNTKTTVYIYITPQLKNANVTYSPNSCPAGSACNITIYNNCPTKLTGENYYDYFNIDITGIPTMQYRVYCDNAYKSVVFQWGLFVLIIIVTLIVSITSLYSRAWSLGGVGIQITYRYIIAFNIVLILGAIVGAASIFAANIIINIFSFVVGTICIGICFNEIFWLFKLKFLNHEIWWKIRVMDIISLSIGLGFTIGWWFSDKNWILNDILSGCIIVALIKTFKFTSMKIAVVGLISTLIIQCGIALIIYFVVKTSYNNLILNEFNNPLELQLPSINRQMLQKCAWLPVTEVIFPGLFISYLRRFDDSRNTKIYLIVSCLSFYVGSTAWMIMSVFNIHSWPFSVFSQPCLILFVVIFAIQRNEIKTIWTGEFYDEQFRDKFEADNLRKSFGKTEKKEVELNESIFGDLKIESKEREMLEGQI